MTPFMEWSIIDIDLQPLVKILPYASDYCGAFRIDEISETRLRIKGAHLKLI